MSALKDGRELPIIFVHSKLDDAGLTANEFRVYGHLARRAGKDGEAFPSVAAIAKVCRMEEKTARAALRTLVNRRMLCRVDRPGQTTAYSLTPESEWIMEEPTQEGSADTPPKRHPSQTAPGATPTEGHRDYPSQTAPDEGNPRKDIPSPHPPEPGGGGGEVVPGPELCQRLGAAFRLTPRELHTLNYGGERLRLVVALKLDHQTLGWLERLWRIPVGETRGGQKIYHATSLTAFLDAPDKDISRARVLFEPPRKFSAVASLPRDVPLPEPEPSPEVKRQRFASLKAAVDPNHRLIHP